MTIAPTPEQLRACLAVERWVQDVVAGGPYEGRADLVEFARASATPLADAEIDEAIAHHPRIGEKPQGSGASAQFSRSEQAGAADSSDDAVNAQIAEGNAAYEKRFGRVFIIRAAGRSRAEILAEQQRRLALAPEDELPLVGEQLVEIAMLRLEQTFPDDGPAAPAAADAPAAGAAAAGAAAAGAAAADARASSDVAPTDGAPA